MESLKLSKKLEQTKDIIKELKKRQEEERRQKKDKKNQNYSIIDLLMNDAKDIIQ